MKFLMHFYRDTLMKLEYHLGKEDFSQEAEKCQVELVKLLINYAMYIRGSVNFSSIYTIFIIK